MNCHNCKHGKIAFQDGMTPIEDDMVLLTSNPKSVLGDMFGKCEQGHMETYTNWWKEHGNVVNDKSEVECYEPTESVKRLQNMINLSEEILEVLKKRK